MLITLLRSARSIRTGRRRVHRFVFNCEPLEDRSLLTVFAGTSQGMFVNPTPPSAVVTGVGTSRFTWGDPSNFGTGPSSLAYTARQFNGQDNQVVSLGTLTYFNGTTLVGTQADTVTLRVGLSLTSPSGVTQNLSFDFPLQLVTTDNTDNPVTSADSVFLPTHFSPSVFTTPTGGRYTMELVGFGPITEGGFSTLDRFNVFEGQSAQAALLARFVTTTATIDINNTPNESDDITLYNPPSSAVAFTQTIPATIRLQGFSGRVDLTVSPPGAATVSPSFVNLSDGGSQVVTITPRANSGVANDVVIKALIGGTEVGSEDMTIVGVLIPTNIRRANTPAGMRDRIPPRVGTPIAIQVTPNLTGSGQAVTLAVDNQNANNGTVTIDGSATRVLTASGNVNLQGGTQTAPTAGFSADNAGKLHAVVQVRGQDTARSQGFSVAAIPVNWNLALDSLVTGTRRGIRVINSWTSDSGNLADLDAVERSEVVQYLPGTGIFTTPPGATNSGYINATLGAITDTHSTPVALLTGPGTVDANQAFQFRDRRTGAQDVPAPNSGYRIRRDVFIDGMVLRITTSKTGMGVTANGITVTAGAGAVSQTQNVI